MHEIPHLFKAFAYVLRTTRKEKRIPQEELARRMDCARSYIAAIEASQKQPTINAFLCFADALEVEPEELFRRLKLTLLVLNNQYETRPEEGPLPQQEERPVRKPRKRMF